VVISITVLKAATIGLVMSLAKPHKEKRQVMRINGIRYFFSNKMPFAFVIVSGLAQLNSKKSVCKNIK
jgi:hypothetical protein